MPDCAVLALVGGKIGKPFCKEALCVKIQARRADEYLRIARPAEALVALRAVGRHIEEVALLPPDHVLKQLVQKWVGAGKISGALHVRVDGDGREVFRRDVFRTAREPVDADVAEAVECQLRLIALRAVFAEIKVFCLCRAVVFRVEVPVFVQNLRVRKLHGFALDTVQRDLHIARQILAEIHDGFAGRRFEDAGGRNAFLLTDRLALLLDQRIGRAVIERGGRPDRRLKCGVIRFAVIQLGKAHGAFRRLPACVCADRVRMAVGIPERQLRRQRGRKRRVAVLIRKPSREAAAIPARADHHCQLIFLTGTDLQIVLLHLQTLLIDCPAGRKDKITHAAAVERCLVDPQCSDPERGGNDVLRAEKRLSERRADVAVRLCGTDPVCRPLHIACLLFRFLIDFYHNRR